MSRQNRDWLVHRIFAIGVIGKAIDGVLEVVGGVALLLVGHDRIGSWMRLLTQHELSEDPHDVIAGFLVRSLQHLSTDTKVFAAMFLLWHGIVKIGLVLGLLRRRLWAYPTAIGAFGLFLGYQLYRYGQTRSLWLLVLSVLDVFVIVITWLEYRRMRRTPLLSRDA